MSTIAEQIIAAAKHLGGGLTDAEFDYALLTGGQAGLSMAISEAVNAELGRIQPGDGRAAVDVHSAREREIWAEISPVLEARKAIARERGFKGWSNTSRGPIRYALDAPTAAQVALAAAEAEVVRLRDERDTLILAARDRGETPYRIAKTLGLQESTIARAIARTQGASS